MKKEILHRDIKNKIVKYTGNINKLTENVFEKDEIANFVLNINRFVVDDIENWETDNIKISFVTEDKSIHSLYVSFDEIEVASN